MKLSSLNLLSNEEILNLKISELELKLPASYKKVITNCHQKLNNKDIVWRPYYWFSDEWFVPDGIAGIALPFTICHPKLIKLEKEFLGHYEGEAPSHFSKLYCHEMGHAIDNAFGLRLKKRRQKIFGLSKKNYPSTYTPKPDNPNFVKHLEDFYAQAHPDEDWAETFAVWLTQKSWRYNYRNKPALLKLEYLDFVMRSDCQSYFFKITSRKYHDYKNDHRTIRKYLEEKKRTLGLNRKNYFSQLLKNEFQCEGKEKAFIFLNKNRTQIISSLKSKKARNPWVIDKCLNDLKEVCKKEDYRLKYNSVDTQQRIIHLIDHQYDDFIKKGRTKVFM